MCDLTGTCIVVKDTGFGSPFPFPVCKYRTHLGIVKQVEPELR